MRLTTSTTCASSSVKHFNEEVLAPVASSARRSRLTVRRAPCTPASASASPPIANEQGKTIAFTARALDSEDEKGRPVAKYLNSPETTLYSKGQVLFNLDKARLRFARSASLFSSKPDGLYLCLHGRYPQCRRHIRHRLHGVAGPPAQPLHSDKQVILNFDPDGAGKNAAEKACALLTEEDFAVRIVTLDDGLDPDRFLRERGLQAYTAAVRERSATTDYLIDRAREEFPGRTADAK